MMTRLTHLGVLTLAACIASSAGAGQTPSKGADHSRSAGSAAAVAASTQTPADQVIELSDPSLSQFCSTTGCDTAGMHADVHWTSGLRGGTVTYLSPKSVEITSPRPAAGDQARRVDLYKCGNEKSETPCNAPKLTMVSLAPDVAPTVVFQLEDAAETKANFGAVISSRYMTALVTADNPTNDTIEISRSSMRFEGTCGNSKSDPPYSWVSVPADEVTGYFSGPHFSLDTAAGWGQAGVADAALLGQQAEHTGSGIFNVFRGASFLPAVSLLSSALLPIKASLDEIRRDQLANLNRALANDIVEVKPHTSTSVIDFVPRQLFEEGDGNAPNPIPCAFSPTNIRVDLNLVQDGPTVVGEKKP